MRLILSFLCFGLILSAHAADLLVRKNAKDFSTLEKTNFITAILRMKEIPSAYDTNYNAYDWLVRLHKLGFDNHLTNGSQIHMSPPFFPWHREYLKAFEAELNRAARNTNITAQITVPYWDWTDTNCTLAVFTNDFMGGNGDGPNSSFNTGPITNRSSPFRVSTGPFGTLDNRTTRFPINTNSTVSGTGSQGAAQLFLQRSFASHQIFGGPDPGPGLPPVTPTYFMLTNLPNAEQVARGLAMTIYDQFRWDYSVETNLDYLARTTFRNFMEGHTGEIARSNDEPFGDQMHGRGHLWVGGSMAAPSSPNDPVFWMHHANLDRLWAEWQDRHGIGNFPPAWFYMGSTNTNSVVVATVTNLLYGFSLASNYTANVKIIDPLDLRANGVRYDTQPDELPVLTASLSGTNALLTTLATPGFIYRLERAVKLTAPWEVWCGPITAAVRTVNFTVPLTPGETNAFFRATVTK